MRSALVFGAIDRQNTKFPQQNTPYVLLRRVGTLLALSLLSWWLSLDPISARIATRDHQQPGHR